MLERDKNLATPSAFNLKERKPMKFDPVMRAAIEKLQGVPKTITLTSNVRHDPKDWDL